MKGSNLIIEETKKELTLFLNKKLQELPIGVIKLILENSLTEINALHNKVVEKEISDYEENQNGNDDSKED